jgi:hypothetical protein
MGNTPANEGANSGAQVKILKEEPAKERDKPGVAQYKEGLISLEKKEFGEAMVFFQAADELGMPPLLSHYLITPYCSSPELFH